MKIVVSGPVREHVDGHGGRLYVWVRKSRCCGGLRTLATAAKPPAGIEFGRADTQCGFELFLPARLEPVPDELQLELSRRARSVAAYWNGCAWLV